MRKGKVEETVEVVEGRAFADYDAAGKLLGVEMLALCLAKVLDQLPSEEHEARALIERTAPRELAVA